MWLTSLALLVASASEPSCAAEADVRHRRDPQAEALAVGRRFARSWDELEARTVECLGESGPRSRCASEVVAWREAWTGCPVAQARVDAAPMWFGGLVAARVRERSAFFDEEASSPHRPFVDMIVRAAQVQLELASWARLEATERGDAGAADAVVAAHFARAVWWSNAARGWWSPGAGGDALLWSRAQAEAEVGRSEAARATLASLIDGYPESPQLGAAWRLLARVGPPSDAPTALRHAAEISGDPLRGFTMFQLAWALYDLEEVDAAISAMTEAVGLESDGIVPRVGLYEVGLAELPRLDESWAMEARGRGCYRSTESEERYRRMLVRLAWLHRERGQLERAVETWRRLIAEQPNHPDNPRWRELVVAAQATLLGPEAAAYELASIRVEFGVASPWWAANLDPAVRARATEIVARAGERAFEDVAEEALEPSRRTWADEASVDAALHDQLHAVRHCVDRERLLQPDLAGGLVLSFRVGLDGHPVDVAIAQHMPGGAHAAACARAVVERMVFGPLQGEERVDVRFPMAFAPGAEAYPRPRTAR